MKPSRFLLALFGALLLVTAAAQDFAPIPPLKTRVTDQAGMLKPEQRAALEAKLEAHETKTGNQVAILLVGSTAPEVIEQYGIRVAESWKIGRKGIDDGVILIIAKNNPRDLRRMRLEVGRGAEGVITDARSKQILQDIIAPKFRQNDFYGGLNGGIDAIHALLDKDAFPSAPKQQTRQVERSGPPVLFIVLMALLPFLGAIIAGISHANRTSSHRGWGRSSSGVFIGGSSGGWSSIDSSSSSDFGGGGGDFGGGGASGDW